jgi:hypothetical protein
MPNRSLSPSSTARAVLCLAVLLTLGAGETWYPVFDSIKEVSSIGSVEVAPSNPNVIYAGAGDKVNGSGVNVGNGMYKSENAGAT